MCKIAVRGAPTWHGFRGHFSHAVNISIGAMRAEWRWAKPAEVIGRHFANLAAVMLSGQGGATSGH
jgi:hypothetical protein